jgi:hypothetical protein
MPVQRRKATWAIMSFFAVRVLLTLIDPDGKPVFENHHSNSGDAGRYQRMWNCDQSPIPRTFEDVILTTHIFLLRLIIEFKEMEQGIHRSGLRNWRGPVCTVNDGFTIRGPYDR